MITKIKKVYYCEFCKKKSMRVDACAKHEEHCTLNINRSCRLCKLEKGRLKPVIDALKNTTKEINLNDIKDVLRNERINLFCPICILTIIRILKLQHIYDEFNYEKECTIFFDECDEKPRNRKVPTSEELRNEINEYLKNGKYNTQ